MTVPSPLYFVLLTVFIAFIAFLADFIADPDALEVADDDKDTHVDTLEVPRGRTRGARGPSAVLD